MENFISSFSFWFVLNIFIPLMNYIFISCIDFLFHTNVVFSWTSFRSSLIFSLISLDTCSTIVLNSSSGLSSESFSLGIIIWIDGYKNRHSSLTFHITCVLHQELDQLNFNFIIVPSPISGSIFNIREEVVIDWVTSLLSWPHIQAPDSTHIPPIE